MFRYFGSKVSTSERIADLVAELAPGGSVADAFGGLGTIGATLRRRGHKITTCDVLTFPHYFQVARIECNAVPKFTKLIDYLGLDSTSGLLDFLNKRRAPSSWIVTEFSTKRKFFTSANATKIAGIWHDFVRWEQAGLLSSREKAFLISSLLNSLDSVANTAGTYYAYLKNFNRKSLKSFEFSWIPVSRGRYVGKARHGDALSELAGKTFDVLYLDPPYNERNYAGYYHFPESLAKLKQPEIRSSSLSGVPVVPHAGAEYIRSGMTLDYLEDLISAVHWNTAIIHYCDDGLIPLINLSASLQKFGNVHEIRMDALGYTTKKIKRSINHHVFVVTRY